MDPTQAPNDNINSPSSSGYKKFLVPLIIAALIAVSGVLGFQLYRESQKSPTATQEPRPTIAQTTTFSNAELGVTLEYPKSWGSASLRDGEVSKPGEGSYKQLVFSKQEKVDINFVTGGFSTPLDGCADPLFVAKHELSRYKASVVGWSNDSIKFYQLDYDAPRSDSNPKYHIAGQSSRPNDQYLGWSKLRSKDKVLEYRPHFEYSRPTTSGGTSCYELTQDQAAEANSFNQILFYAVNLETTKAKGINATYDIRDGEDLETRDQLLSVLGSIKRIN